MGPDCMLDWPGPVPGHRGLEDDLVRVASKVVLSSVMSEEIES